MDTELRGGVASSCMGEMRWRTSAGRAAAHDHVTVHTPPGPCGQWSCESRGGEQPADRCGCEYMYDDCRLTCGYVIPTSCVVPGGAAVGRFWVHAYLLASLLEARVKKSDDTIMTSKSRHNPSFSNADQVNNGYSTSQYGPPQRAEGPYADGGRALGSCV